MVFFLWGGYGENGRNGINGNYAAKGNYFTLYSFHFTLSPYFHHPA